MPVKFVDNGEIDMNTILLEILNSESSFGSEMRDKIASSLDIATNKIKLGVGAMNFSKDPITISSIAGIDENERKNTATQFKNQQKKILHQLKEIARASNFKQIKKGVNITDLLGSDKTQNERFQKQYQTLQKKILATLKANIPTKVDILPKVATSKGVEQPIPEMPKSVAEQKAPAFGIAGLEHKKAMLMPPVSDVFKEDKKPELTNTNNKFISSLFDKLNNVIKSNKFGSDGSVKGREAFIEDKPQPVILSEISDDAIKSLTSIMNTIGSKAKKASKFGANDIERLLSTKDIQKLSGVKGIKTGLLAGLSSGLTSAILLKAKGAPTWLAKAGPATAFVGAIIWMAIDGFKGWMKSGEWNTNKISGAIGGIVGGMDSGLMGTIKNMGKWALLGAGIGSVVPVIGTLIGGIIGAALGAILGWIGGERIAKSMDAVGNWFKEKHAKTMEWIKTFLESDIEKRWELLKKAIIAPFTWMEKKSIEILDWIDNKLTNIFGDKWTNFKNTIEKIPNWIGEKVEDINIWIDDKLYRLFGERWEEFKTSIETISNWFEEKIIIPIKNFFSLEHMNDWGLILTKFFTEDLPNWIKEKIKSIMDVGGKIKDVGSNVWGTIKNKIAGTKEERIRDTENRIKTMELEGSSTEKIERKRKYLNEMLSEPEAKDFIYRPGQPMQKFSSDDVIIGAKEKLVIENKNLDKQMYDLMNVMKDIKGNFEDLIVISAKMLERRSLQPSMAQPLPEISYNINAHSALAYNDAYNHKMKVWEFLHGVT